MGVRHTKAFLVGFIVLGSGLLIQCGNIDQLNDDELLDRLNVLSNEGRECADDFYETARMLADRRCGRLVPVIKTYIRRLKESEAAVYPCRESSIYSYLDDCIACFEETPRFKDMIHRARNGASWERADAIRGLSCMRSPLSIKYLVPMYDDLAYPAKPGARWVYGQRICDMALMATVNTVAWGTEEVKSVRGRLEYEPSEFDKWKRWWEIHRNDPMFACNP